MGSEWRIIKVEDIQAEKKGAIAIGPFGSRMKSDCYVARGIPVIRGTNISVSPAFKGDFVFIAEELADSLGSCNVYEGDLVFPHRGSIGEVGIVPPNKRYVISSSLMKLTCNRKIAVPEYLYYFFKSHNGRHELTKNASQVGTPGIGQPLTSLKSIELPLPPLPIQKNIARILGTLDNKIELNCQMNTTLESMAQALFKSWFVDFDPVIDNALAAGNPIPDELAARAERRKQTHDRKDASSSEHFKPGQPLPAAIQQQFPDRFVFTEAMGWVPEGWSSPLLTDFGSVVCGKTPSKSRAEYFGEDIPFIKIPDMHTTMFVVNPTEKLSKLGADSQIKKMIPRGSICVSCIATVGKVVIATTESQTNQQINSIVPREQYLTPYLYFYMLNLENHFHDLASGGSATLNMNTSTFSKVTLLKPDEALLQTFGDTMQPQFNKIENNQRENMTLSSLRDTLLPKLLSGQLRIPEAEQQIAEII